MGICNCCSPSESEYAYSKGIDDTVSKFERKGKLDLIAYDFDQTVTMIHLYHE